MPRPTPFATLAAAVLAGCAAIVPGTAARLAALDPLTADPAGIEVALILPDGLELRPGTALLTLAGQRGAETLSGRFLLASRAVPGVSVPAGAHVEGFGLAAADQERMHRLQDDIAGWKASGAAQGTLSLSITGCAVGAGPEPDARGAALIRLSADEEFRPLIRPTALAALLGDAALAALGPCDGDD